MSPLANGPVRPGQHHTEPVTPDDRPTILALLGDVRGCAVLDLGCADPGLGRDLLTQGARRYLGLVNDAPTAAAVGLGLAGTDSEVREEDLNRWSGHDLGTFDIAVSRHGLHQVRNLARLLDTLYHHVARGGRLVFSVPHPMATASIRRPATGGAGPEWVVDDYFREGPRPDPFVSPSDTGHPVVVHRRLGTYLRELRYSGFRLEELHEGPIEVVATDAAAPPARRPDLPHWVALRCRRP